MQKEAIAEVSIPGGFWVRALAALIDGLVLVIPNKLLESTLSMYERGEDFRYNPVAFFVSLCLIGVYAGFLYSLNGATLGKKVFGLKVVDNESGSYISFLRGFFREVIGKYVSLLALGIGFLMVPFTKNKRALHDKIFDTRVIKVVRGSQFVPPQDQDTSF